MQNEIFGFMDRLNRVFISSLALAIFIFMVEYWIKKLWAAFKKKRRK